MKTVLTMPVSTVFDIYCECSKNVRLIFNDHIRVIYQ